MMTDAQVDLRNVQRGLASGLRNAEGFTSHVVSEVRYVSFVVII